jgi:hypothetical protein
VSDIPLFPLNVVLMPGAPLPLHIFEDRYKQMVNECLEQESEFGMVLADESGTRRVGCTARIVELVERYEDGRMLILVEGSRRFKLNSILTGKPYYVGEVDYLEEEREEDVTALAEECIELLERVVEAATEGSVGIEIQPPSTWKRGSRSSSSPRRRGVSRRSRSSSPPPRRGSSASNRPARRPRGMVTCAETGGRGRKRRRSQAARSRATSCWPRGAGSFRPLAAGAP